MKLIKDLGTKRINENMIRYGLFYCEYCNKKVEKIYKNGISAKSCNCMQRTLHNEAITIHGENHCNSRLYRIWYGMRNRCNNPNNKDYIRYGGKGIKVCEIWQKSYIIFKIWALLHGYKDDLTIDRIDSGGNYEMSNCQWITVKENSQKTSQHKLNKYKADLLRKLYNKCKIEKKIIAWLFDISPHQTCTIINNKHWV